MYIPDKLANEVEIDLILTVPVVTVGVEIMEGICV